MSIDRLKGKPLLIDKLRPELGGEVVKLVADDMERAVAAKKKKKDKRDRKR